MYNLYVISKINCTWIEVQQSAKGYKNSMNCESQTTSIYCTETSTNVESITMVTAAKSQPQIFPADKNFFPAFSIALTVCVYRHIILGLRHDQTIFVFWKKFTYF